MSHNFWLGIALILISGVFNGSFALPMKYTRSWRWENTWLVFSLCALLILPVLLAVTFTPRLFEIYRGVQTSAILLPLLFGFLWGFAQVTFGLGIVAVGMALAFAVVMGLTCLFGSLVPLMVLYAGDLLQARGLCLLASMPFLLFGLTYCGIAGNRREKETAKSGGVQNAKMSFATGLAICIFTGVFGANLNLGFAFSGSIIPRGQALGANAITGTYAVWALVLCAGFVPNLAYCCFLLFRNRTWTLFRRAGWLKEGVIGIIMALFWLAGIIGYGGGATLVGKYGTSIGFVLFVAVIILASNSLGLLSGEWKGSSKKTMRDLAVGVGAILISIFILNLGGLM